MRSLLKLLPGVVIAGCFAVIAVSAQEDLAPVSAQNWSIDIATVPRAIYCRKKPIPVPAANSCPAAISVAREVFKSAGNRTCICRTGRIVIPWEPSCTLNIGGSLASRESFVYRVSFPYHCEKDISDCDEAAVMRDGQPVFPAGATDIEPAVEVDEDRGLLSSLYPGLDTTTDEFYPLPCESSIGGELPPEVDETPTIDEAEVEEFIDNFEETEGPRIVEDLTVNEGMAKFAPLNSPQSASPCSIRPNKLPCNSPRFLLPGQPFEGRDIIYVHGFATEHLTKWVTGDEGAHQLWPKNPAEFLEDGGYFREYAKDHWRAHIRENLFDPLNPFNTNVGWQWTASDPVPVYKRKSNRYLIVAWSSNQTLEYAQHALLEQIQLAISFDKNVKTSPSFPSTHKRPFCSNGCIIISHSAGGLVVSTAMSRAISGDFGPGAAQIPGHIRAHVAFEGAMAGSRLATLGMAVGLAASVPQTACNLFNRLFNINGNCLEDTKFVAHSILRDLMPFVAQGVWGRVVGSSPVPTVTVAGGHPTGNSLGVTKILLPGLDDGVVSMNSACGNPNPVYPHLIAPSGIVVTSNVKAFDFSEKPDLLLRGVKNYISHKHLMGGLNPSSALPGSPFYLAGGCTPYLSPTGMVMPVLFALKYTPWSTRARYGNHFSFIQGSIDHYYDGGSDGDNPWPSATGAPASANRHYLQHLGPNTEESSAITDKGIFMKFSDGTYLVHPSFGNREVVRGRKITFRFFGKKRTIWIWKRTYHLLDKWEQKQSSHYVYEFVGRR